MSLAGLTRDSIVGLSDLLKDHHEENKDRYIKKSSSFVMKHSGDLSSFGVNTNTISSNEEEDDFLFLEDMDGEQEEEAKIPDQPRALEDEVLSISSQSTNASGKEQGDAGAYAGFAYDYGDYGDYYSDPYAPVSNLGKKNKSGNGFGRLIGCIFPWTKKKNIGDEDGKDDDDAVQQTGTVAKREHQQEGQQQNQQQHKTRREKDPSAVYEEEKKCPHDEPADGDTDTAVSDSDAYGEKMTDKDRKAVLARLRLSQPSPPPPPSEIQTDEKASILDKLQSPPPSTLKGLTVSTDQESKEEQKTESSSSQTEAQSESLSTPAEPSPPEATEPEPPKLPKGILKKTSTNVSLAKTIAPPNANLTKNKNNPKDNSRRNLFPKYEPRSLPESSGPASPTSHTSETTIKYNVNFSPMARVITIASHNDMSFVEKSRVWFQRSDYDEFKKTGRIIAKAMLAGGSEIWLTTSNAWGRKSTQQKQTKGEVDSEYDRALQKYMNISKANNGGKPSDQEAGETPAENEDDVGGKWWCKFGHSRRGLEHIASSSEGQQRQRNVNTAIQAVLAEQRRQRISRTKDSRKLATIAYQYTSWARDLALAAGMADAEAVQSNFCVTSKTRICHLRASLIEKSMSCSIANNDLTTGKWRGIIGASSPSCLTSERLDAHTSSGVMYRQQQQTMRAKRIMNSTPMPKTPIAKTPIAPGVVEEAIHDPVAHAANIAKKAAGFGVGEDSKDMSAVLTGMGGRTTAVR